MTDEFNFCFSLCKNTKTVIKKKKRKKKENYMITVLCPAKCRD